MKDVFVSLASRDRPDLLSRFISEVYSSSYNRNNFDIYIIIDNDQRDTYKKQISQYPEILWDFLPHKKNGLNHLYLRAFQKFLASDYYFFWPMVDDIFGFTREWDKQIILKKHAFMDDLFCLFTANETHGRNNEVKASCYSIPHKRKNRKGVIFDSVPVQPSDWAMIHGMSELFPVFSKKWVYFLDKFYQKTQCPGGLDIVTAALLQQLYILYNENRNIMALPAGLECINHYTNHHLMEEKSRPFERKDVKIIVKEMYQYIKEKS